jgi:hypothetical protein
LEVVQIMDPQRGALEEVEHRRTSQQSETGEENKNHPRTMFL